MMPGGAAAYGGYKAESSESRALRSFASDKFDYRDQGKNLIQLNNAVGFISGMMRKQQRAIDQANQNFIQQLQSLITDLIVMLGGGGDTGLDFGDLKYVIQAIGAMFGFADENGNITVPVNIFNAAWHFFSNYLGGTANFRELIDQLIDNAIATVLDLFGEVPIAGQALQQLAVFISDIRDLLLPVVDALQTLLDSLNIQLDDIQGIADFFGPLKPLVDALFEALEGIDLPDFSAALRMLIQLGTPLINLIAKAILAVAAFIKMLTGQGTIQQFGDALAAMTLAVDPNAGGGNGLSFGDIGQGLLQTVLADMLGGADWTELFQELTGQSGGLADLGNWLKTNLFGPILPSRLTSIPVASIANTGQNALINPSFTGPDSVETIGSFTHDAVDGHSAAGCASVTADGTRKSIVSNFIPAVEGQKWDIHAWTKYIGLVATAGQNAIRLNVIGYNNNTLVRTDMVTSITSPTGTSANGAPHNNFVQIPPVSYIVPAGVNRFVLEAMVTEAATAGTVKFDDGWVAPTGLLPQWLVQNLPQDLQDTIAFAQTIINKLWTTFSGFESPVDILIEELQDIMSSIPPDHVQGLSGGTIIDTFQNTINALWNGFARATGQVNKSIIDVANQASDTVDTAVTSRDLGEWNNAILGIRDANGFFSGTDPTAKSMYPIPDWPASGDPVAVTASSSNVPIAFWFAEEDAKRGSVQWFGKGNANITAFFVDVYKINYTTMQLEFLHTSPDLLPQLSAGWKKITYNMLTADRVDVVHGDVLAFAFRVTGTGTHQIQVKPLGTMPNDTTRHPFRPCAIRTGVGTINLASLNYTGDYPWVTVGIVEGDVAPPFYAPRTTQFNSVGTFVYDVPPWAKYVDGVLCGAAGGGKGGNGGDTRPGYGGNAGEWRGETLVRGIDFPDIPNAQIIFDIGAGGQGGNKEQNGSTGGVTRRRAISGGKAELNAPAGAGATQYGSGTDPMSTGRSPGDFTFAGKLYNGGIGGTGGRPGANGGSPGAGGGGGYGGIYTVAYAGGDGGRGAGWATARQS
ncbi:minor tail protein [Mycobacterium phage DrLupo]|uniref:Minor tail protein n=1 Tax=Mycobacterium phage DrLupo TaxID=2499037 RepID=A0A3S9UQL6_9CAUD|nr:minor tail protein [Mycobacterium phage DrLupo]AZS12574.1 minor tail protein [Mycobacterium phage DrLupo]